jgi:hypothetical protein
MEDNTKSRGRWSDDEHDRYVKGLELYGQEFKLLESFVQTRTALQIKTHHGVCTRNLKGAVAVAGLASGMTKKRKSVALEDKGSPKKAKGDSATQSSPQAAKVVVGAPIAQSSPCQVSVDSSDTMKDPPTILRFPTLSTNGTEATGGDDLKPPAQMPSMVPVQRSSKKSEVSSTSDVSDTEATGSDDLKPPAQMPSIVPVERSSKESEVSPTSDVSDAKKVAQQSKPADIMAARPSMVYKLLQRDDVQSVLAGVGGFIIVVFVKKIFA